MPAKSKRKVAQKETGADAGESYDSDLKDSDVESISGTKCRAILNQCSILGGFDAERQREKGEKEREAD